MPLEHVDVLIVGAGLSGIGAASHLQAECPGKTYAIFEARGAIGGTWDLFRYPGVRSDSDMFTLGYSFEPWTEAKAIADGTSIREYVQRTARTRGIDRKIRFHHRVVRAEWSSDEALWTVEAKRSDTGETVRVTCGFLYVNSGYYRYDQGYAPEFPGQDTFAGTIVHPQHWPEDLDYTGKRVVVIGSGATAVTLLPAMAGDAAHVTMLQRSPSYVLSLPGTDPLADKLRGILPPKVAYPVVRWKNVLTSMLFFQLSRRVPGVVKKLLRKGVSAQVPEGFDVDRHFAPSYDPWDQRVCFVPDGDLFKAVRRGKADIVTDTIEKFTPEGIRLSSGRVLEADIIVTATGLNLLPFGGLELVVDGEPVEIGKRLAYKGMMLSGVPNYAFTIGYTNASWTLKADLVAGYVCRLLNHLDERGLTTCTPVPGPSVTAAAPLIDLKSGYVLRSIDKLPKQGPSAPWRLFQNYPRDVLLMRHGSLEDGAMRFSRTVKPAKERVA
ncbi:flavin-containing monooxygenase [Amycolatopsis thermophila]|uniref:Cation diffusion facilitator CzcD-associated flavoprotein CzcO n=1 Tax=Amycolatopsis thermophila TaxID=206084 RepID=A0ABU0EM74_9PSEU|nr:NAD(P)/FAD-dependent oxidoreductase [Amycolatopsis thermophila]MDQ0376120.1 cation diffusion facilitator CzcD-associated flavoprotein CzcO [Amycolatopsis thermophila]